MKTFLYVETKPLGLQNSYTRLGDTKTANVLMLLAIDCTGSASLEYNLCVGFWFRGGYKWSRKGAVSGGASSPTPRRWLATAWRSFGFQGRLSSVTICATWRPPLERTVHKSSQIYINSK